MSGTLILGVIMGVIPWGMMLGLPGLLIQLVGLGVLLGAVLSHWMD